MTKVENKTNKQKNITYNNKYTYLFHKRHHVCWQHVDYMLDKSNPCGDKFFY